MSDQGFRPRGNATRQQRRYRGPYTPPVMVTALDDVPASWGDDDERRDVFVCSTSTPHMGDLVAMAGDGWTVAADGHWPTLRRGRLTVRWLASWTGQAMAPDDADGLWRMVETALARMAPGARPLGAPATTGRDLWLRLIPDGVSYELVDPDTAELLRGTAGQGRVEMFPAGPMLREIVEYDARLAYLSALNELPHGSPRWLDGADARRWQDEHPYGRARYRCGWAAPKGWDRPGILPQQAIIAERGGAWPMRGDGDGWCDGSELALARRHGWKVTVREALVWDQTCSPFRLWADRLVRCSQRPPRGAEAGVWRAVFRAVAIQTIGAMHGAPRKITRIGARRTAPEGATPRRIDGTDLERWVETTPALWPETHHPEWTATVWSRARCRLLDAPAGRGAPRVGALHVPAGDVVGFRNDAVYLARDPGWPDDGALGRFRQKRAVKFDRPQPRPTTQTALLGLLDGQEGS